MECSPHSHLPLPCQKRSPSRNDGAVGPRSHLREAGVALVMVLSFLVLITALVIAFFASITTELTSAGSYADGTTSRQLADSAVQMVMSAIRDGTYADDGVGNIAAWASQPGMIRTYDSNGGKLAYYKLYSSNNMVVSKAQISAFTYQNSDLKINSSAGIKDWANQPAIFMDLNMPKRGVYPIVTPAAIDDSVNNTGVPYFRVDSTSTSPVVTTGTTPNPVPMPVRWIYVLRDGTMSTPDSVDTTGKRATWTGTTTYSQPSASNPIVGRLAFWTDDETCKVNLNTASEGTFWDTPRTFTNYEFEQLAKYEPAQKEFQRYPGHPAMTSLSAIFRKMTDKEAIYKMVPRTAGGGSLAGTTVAAAGLTTPLNRLFASVDEFMFDPDTRQPPFEKLDSSGNGSVPLTRDEVEQARFFVTANSRASDLNLFGKPRVSMWPITLDPSNSAPLTTPFDRLISFCTTVNNSIYYFQRQDPNDPRTDLPTAASATGLGRNQMLLNYLHDLTSRKVPGFSSNAIATFLNKYPSDQDQILTEIFDYVRSTNLRDSTLDVAQGGNTIQFWKGQYTKVLDANNAAHPTDDKYQGGVGQVVPIVNQAVTVPGQSGVNPRGFGRFPTLEQFSLVFIGTKDSSTNANDTKDGGGNITIPKVDTGKIRVQAAAFAQLFDPSQGMVLEKPWYALKVSGLDGFKWADSSTGTSASMKFPAAQSLPRSGNYNFTGGTFFGGAIDFRQMFDESGDSYPLISQETGPVNAAGVGTGTADFANGGTFLFTGGDIKVEIYNLTPAGTPNTLVQTITLTIPSGEFPVPQLAPATATANGSGTDPASANFRAFKGGRLSANPRIPFIASTDTVRSVVASPGDMRLIAAHQTVTKAQSASLYLPHPNYFIKTNTTAGHLAHNLYTGKGWPYYGASGGKLVNLTYPGYQNQYLVNVVNGSGADLGWGGTAVVDTNVPSQNGVLQADGSTAADWDNGVANLKDGAYINKADEGAGNTQTFFGNYFGMEFTGTGNAAGPTFFSPNRLIPSAGMFGSLPTGVWSNKPWQTLLFRPGPDGHFGLGFPYGDPPYSRYLPDQLFLDLFHMPVVEPYAISEPMSTAGRINMNYQIAPFSYITRDSGIRALLKAEQILSIPDSSSTKYKTTQNAQVEGNVTQTTSLRLNINAAATLLQFQARFDKNDLFRSASEICNIDLIPADAPNITSGSTAHSTMEAYWSTHKLTGDNSREKPYTNLYPRLTTKSNTYTVHMRVQTLRQIPAGRSTDADWKTWNEVKDAVTSEYRGSQLIERYIDTSDTTLPDYAAPANFSPPTGSNAKKNLDAYYKFRVISSKQFAP